MLGLVSGSVREQAVAERLLVDLAERGLAVNDGVLVITEESRTPDQSLDHVWRGRVQISQSSLIRAITLGTRLWILLACQGKMPPRNMAQREVELLRLRNQSSASVAEFPRPLGQTTSAGFALEPGHGFEKRDFPKGGTWLDSLSGGAGGHPRSSRRTL